MRPYQQLHLGKTAAAYADEDAAQRLLDTGEGCRVQDLAFLGDVLRIA